MPPPETLTTAVDAYKQKQGVSGAEARAIKTKVGTFANAFEFNGGEVVLHRYRVPTSLDDATTAFITWLREQAYTVVHESTGLYLPEVNAFTDEKIANLENEKAAMQARIETLQKSNAAIDAELRTIKAKEHEGEARINARDHENSRLQQTIDLMGRQIAQKDATIAASNAEMARVTREGSAKTLRINQQEDTIGNMRVHTKDLAETNKALETDNARLVEENRRLETENRARRIPHHLAPQPQGGAIDLLLAKTLPPIIMDMCRCIAPAAASILNSTGMSRVLKKRKRDDDDN